MGFIDLKNLDENCYYDDMVYRFKDKGFDSWAYGVFIKNEPLEKVKLALEGKMYYQMLMTREEIERLNYTNIHVDENGRKYINYQNRNECTLNLHSISVEDSGKGRGSELLQWICEIADDYDMDIKFLFLMGDRIGIPYGKLYSWYLRFGFKPYRNTGMVRYRKTEREKEIGQEILKSVSKKKHCLLTVMNAMMNDDGYPERTMFSFITEKSFLMSLINAPSDKQMTLADLKFLKNIIDSICETIDVDFEDDVDYEEFDSQAEALMSEIEDVLDGYKEK